MKKAFLDANIILDFLDSQRKLHESTKRLLEVLIDLNYCIVISEDIFTTIYYIVKDKHMVLQWLKIIMDQWDVVCFGKELISKSTDICKPIPHVISKMCCSR